MSSTSFTLEYALSLIVTLVVIQLLVQKNPSMNKVVVVIGGLVVAYIALIIINFVLPKADEVGKDMYQYSLYSIMNNFNNTGYLHVWPPILAVLIIFVVLLYNRNLG